MQLAKDDEEVCFTRYFEGVTPEHQIDLIKQLMKIHRKQTRGT